MSGRRWESFWPPGWPRPLPTMPPPSLIADIYLFALWMNMQNWSDLLASVCPCYRGPFMLPRLWLLGGGAPSDQRPDSRPFTSLRYLELREQQPTEPRFKFRFESAVWAPKSWNSEWTTRLVGGCDHFKYCLSPLLLPLITAPAVALICAPAVPPPASTQPGFQSWPHLIWQPLPAHMLLSEGWSAGLNRSRQSRAARQERASVHQPEQTLPVRRCYR